MKLILGIETSCDETSVALTRPNGTRVHQVTASQVEIHRPFRGVVPEIAARQHLALLPVIYESLMEKAGYDLKDVDLIAVTHGPGLVAALLVGVAFARGLAVASQTSLVGVNHLEGHLFSPFLGKKVPEEFLGLVVSGSHASIYQVRRDQIRRLNMNRDDAPGEAFDKVARLLKLPYPGGPEIDRLSASGDENAYPFKMPRMSDGSLDFSFSGIKSAVSRHVRRESARLFDPSGTLSSRGADLAASFQEAVVEHLMDRVTVYSREFPMPDLAVSGGVAANSRLREKLSEFGDREGVRIHYPENDVTMDNASMIAFRGAMVLREGRLPDDPFELDADPRLGQR